MSTSNFAVGVDLGGTSIKLGIVSNKGAIVKKYSIETRAEEGHERVIKQINKGIAHLLKNNKKFISGIGIGAPGAVNTKKGTIEYPPNIPGWKKVALGKILNKEFGLPVFIENDANAAAIGELIFGAGKKYDNFIMATLGTGVGGGIIINKKIFRGESGGAGELGHMTIDANGKDCKCGSKGCIETYIGNSYLTESVKAKLSENSDSKVFELIGGDYSRLEPKIIYDALILGDQFAAEVVENIGFELGCALASAVNLLDISKIIIGGGVAGFGKPLFDAIEKTVKERVLTSFSPRVKVNAAKLKNNAGIKGASSLVFYSI